MNIHNDGIALHEACALLSQMIWILLSVLLLARAQLEPQFTCWFHTYAQGIRQTNYVFGYNNSEPIESQEPLGLHNALTPAQYNGLQPDVFLRGSQPFGFVVRDTLGQGVSWQLRQQSVQTPEPVPGMQCARRFAGSCPLWIEHFCEDSLYCNGAETCFSSAIFGMATPRVMGRCVGPAQGVQCGAPHVCSESTLGCQAPPTAAPTTAPTAPTEAPTLSPDDAALIVPLLQCWYAAPDTTPQGDRSRAMTYLVMAYNNTASQVVRRARAFGAGLVNNALKPAQFDGAQPELFAIGAHRSFVLPVPPTVMNSTGVAWHLGRNLLVVRQSNLVPERHCSVQPARTLAPTPAPTPPPTMQWVSCTQSSDCVAQTSFCYGVSHCDLQQARCVHNTSFTACGFGGQVSSSGSGTAHIGATHCIEHLQLCAPTLSCVVNQDCNNGDLCDGEEWCSNGTCQYQNDTSVLAICGTTRAVCIPGEGCVFTGYAISNAAIVAIVVVGSVLLALIGVGLYYYVRYVDSMAPEEKRTRKNK